MTKFYRHKRVFVTGGAGFIGHHLVDALLGLGANVTVGDNLSTGSISNILKVWRKHNISYHKTAWGYQAGAHKLVNIDFQDYKDTLSALKNQEILFHLAATIGGRGYIDTHPADCCTGFSVNQNVIKSAYHAGVQRLQFASSACVYPVDMQNTYASRHLLKEPDAFKKGWGNADREYGWAKLAGEMTLQAYCRQYGLKGVSTRYVTAYGPGENDTHAITMLIRRAVERQDPYTIWGTGKQDRDFTYVDDIVAGTLAACEHITSGDAVNIGTGRRRTIDDVAQTIFDIIGWRPKMIRHDTTKPEGVKTRALSVQKAKKLMSWRPHTSLRDGLERTIKWFIKEKPESVETMH